MRHFGNILFSPLGRDDNPSALRRIRDVVDGGTAKVTLLGVAAAPSRLQRLLHRPGLVDDVAAAERERLATALDRWTRTVDLGVEVDVDVDVGEAAETIVNRVVDHDHDLVVVTTDEDREDRATIRRLLRQCPCPVWVIRPTRARVQRVLAAVNPDPDEADLNQTILDIAGSLVDIGGGELHAVHAWELYGEAAMRSSAFMHVPPAELEAILHDEQRKHQQALDEVLSSTPFAKHGGQTHLLKGAPHDVIPALVAKRRINILVMGTVARAGVSGMVMGNTAERVLDEVRCSVVAVKPDGFVAET